MARAVAIADASVLIALKQVEVLRDGAAAQYGSDAIAGVMNFILKDDFEGFHVDARSGISERGELLSARIAMAVAIAVATYLGLNPPGFAAPSVAESISAIWSRPSAVWMFQVKATRSRQ